MTAYPTALDIDTGSADERLELAARALATGGVLRFERAIALRTAGRTLRCEVIDPEPGAHRCAQEYEVLIENARRRLEGSPLNDLLPRLPQQWSVVEVSGARVATLWPEP